MKNKRTLYPAGLLILAAAAAVAAVSCVSYGSGDEFYYYDQYEASEELGYSLLDSYYEYLSSVDNEEDETAKKRLAVVNFVDSEGNKSEMGKQFSEGVRKVLFEEQIFSILERDRIESMLEEVKFTRSGMVDESTAAELGGLLGAELVLIGTCSPFRDSYSEEEGFQIDARIVHIETGEIRGIGKVFYIVE